MEIKAPENIQEKWHKQIKNTSSYFQKDLKKIFLAGSIDMGSAVNWQKTVISLLPNNIFLNPRRDDWDNSWEQKFSNANFYQQVNWELRALELSDHIFMHITKDSKAPITLLELGLYADSGKISISCEEGFWRKGNIEIIADKFNIPLFKGIEQHIFYLKNK